MDVLIKILQFILSFSLLVIVHEFGHFLFAKIFGVRVEQFQLFFGKPWLKVRRGDTLYGIGWIPFGGFVKLSGMIDESMDTAQMEGEPQPWEFRTKPAWQRLLIMVGGVMMNVVLALVIYIGMIQAWGESYISTDEMRYGMVFSPAAEELGFRDGDLILSVGGERTDDYQRLVTKVLIEPGAEVVVLRDDVEHTFTMPVTSIMDYMEDPDLIAPRYPFDVAEVVEGYGAAEAGIEVGDRLVSLGGRPMRYFDEYTSELPKVAGRTVMLGIERDSAGVTLYKELTVAVSEDGLIGISVDGSKVMKVLSHEYGFWGSIPAGIKRVGREISDYWKQVKMMVKPKTEAYKALGGPLSIGNIFPNEWSWERFWNITALLSIILAVMNILPIPALDGGHVLFLIAEVITGRKPSDKFLMYAQTVGMMLLMTLMVYATWNDIMRIFVN